MTTTKRSQPAGSGACTVYSDGGARGNPGPAAAAGVIIAGDGTVIEEVTEFLGSTTNNVAEYRALILTLRRAAELGCKRVAIKLDSELVVKQLNGQYRVKDDKMIPLHAEVRRILAGFEEHSIEHVSRNANKHADKLVNAVLDAHAAAMRERAQ